CGRPRRPGRQARRGGRPVGGALQPGRARPAPVRGVPGGRRRRTRLARLGRPRAFAPDVRRARPRRGPPRRRGHRRGSGKLNGSTGGADGQLTVGLVGLGYWGPNLLRALSEKEHITVKRMCGLDRERLERFARKYPAVEPTTRYQDLLDDPEIEAILVATPV